MTVKQNDRLIGFGVAAAALLTGFTTTASAQTATTSARSDDVVVTARRREETLQTVPVSVAVISGEQIQARGIETQESFNRMIPNLVIHGSNGFFARQEGGFNIRGVGNVTVYYDGIAHPETFGIPLSNIIEVERVEILRGPQGTLFGKDTMGGAIQYITKKPADTYGARIKLATGSYNRFDTTAIVDIPLSETLKTKWTVAKLTRDGYMKSVTVPMTFGSQNDLYAEGDILWEPTSNFSFRVTPSWQDSENNGNPITTWALSTGVGTGANPCATTNPAGKNAPDLTCLYNQIGLTIPQTWNYGASEDYKTASTYQGPALYTRIRGVSAQMNYQFTDNWAAKVLGGYRKVRNFDYTDFDATKWNIFEGKNYNEQDEGTIEGQLLFSSDRVTGTTGVFSYVDNRRAHRMNWFQNELKAAVNPANNAAAIAWLTSHINPLTGLPYPTFADSAGGPVGGSAAGNADVNSLQYNNTKGWAVFADWTLKVTDKLSATLGVRYNHDHNITTNYAPLYALPVKCCEPIPSVATNGAGAVGAIRDATFTNTAPKASVQYQWTPDIMTFASYSEGFNRGGATPTNTVPIVLIPFTPEKLKNKEVGVRSEFLDGRMRFNATYFYSNYEDYQVSQDVNKINVTRNAGSAVTKGVEIDGQFAITEAFNINYSYGYNDAQITELAPGVTANVKVGQVLAYAPKQSFSAGVSYDWMLPSGAGVNARADYGWQSEAYTTNDFTNRVLIPSYGIMNARLTYTDKGGKWDVQLSASNLLNEYYRINGYLVPNLYNDVGTPGRPREYGVTLNMKF
ncbi:MAG TPA: TonB-dependent receptor [Caulobacterales bacterium]|nr:TonB-dependent receptor [Caulobacterales bacterium]